MVAAAAVEAVAAATAASGTTQARRAMARGCKRGIRGSSAPNTRKVPSAGQGETLGAHDKGYVQCLAASPFLVEFAESWGACYETQRNAELMMLPP